MPMVADSPFGVLDATLADEAMVVPWDRVYRVRPRSRLVCRACHKAMHAKVSKCGLRFFAHDAANKTCPLTGETLQHRLLKSALAGTIRQCGWHAELEARAEDGRWIGDVLATSPDGSRQVVWEAQLARQHDYDTLGRTAKYLADGIDVVWVFDRFTTPKAPHITVDVQDRDIRVLRPLASLRTSRCSDGERCSRYSTLLQPPPCPGHGTWESIECVLDEFVAGVCARELRWLPVPTLDVPTHGRPSPPRAQAWIHGTDEIAAGDLSQAQLDADSAAAVIARKERKQQAAQRQREEEELAHQLEQQRQQREQLRLYEEQRRKEQEREQLQRQRAQEQVARQQELQRQQREELQRQQEERRRSIETSQRRKGNDSKDQHAMRKAALLKRQRELTPEVTEIVTRDTGVAPWTVDEGDPEHAMGVSVFVGSDIVAVICPVAARITPEVADRMAAITVYVASDEEHGKIARQCRSDQKIVTLHAVPTLW